jgi:hypothetical protein
MKALTFLGYPRERRHVDALAGIPVKVTSNPKQVVALHFKHSGLHTVLRTVMEITAPVVRKWCFVRAIIGGMAWTTGLLHGEPRWSESSPAEARIMLRQENALPGIPKSLRARQHKSGRNITAVAVTAVVGSAVFFPEQQKRHAGAAQLLVYDRPIQLRLVPLTRCGTPERREQQRR